MVSKFYIRCRKYRPIVYYLEDCLNTSDLYPIYKFIFVPIALINSINVSYSTLNVGYLRLYCFFHVINNESQTTIDRKKTLQVIYQ